MTKHKNVTGKHEGAYYRATYACDGFPSFSNSRETVSNPILYHILEKEPEIRAIIYNTICTHSTKGLPTLEIDDIFQALLEKACDTEKITRRFEWVEERKHLSSYGYKKYFYAVVKNMIIDEIKTEVRRKKRASQPTERWQKIHVPTREETKEFYDDMEYWKETEEDGTIVYPYMGETNGIAEGESWDIRDAKKIRDIRKLPQVVFEYQNPTWMDIYSMLNETEREILRLHLEGFTIVQISQKIGKACQYPLAKIKNKIKEYTITDDLLNVTEAYYHVQKQKKESKREKIQIRERVSRNLITE